MLNPKDQHIGDVLERESDSAEDLLDKANVIVLVLDHRGRIVLYNHCLEEISGRRLEEMHGADWFETFLPYQERPKVQRIFSRAMAGAPTLGHINPILCADGGERQIEWYSNTLRDRRSKAVTGVLAIGLDVSDRLHLEEQFQQIQKMEAIGRLAGGVAHDFNTLLGSITGYSEMLLEHLPADHPLRHAAEQILRCSARGAELTGRLLAFSRQQAVEMRPLDLTALLIETRDLLERMAGDDIELVWDLNAEHSVVEADAGQLEQVVMNLVINAVDAMPRGGHLNIHLESIELDRVSPFCPSLEMPAGCYLHLSVRDDGIGMDEATRSRIFEPFFTTKETGKGTGLGLSTVYGIVQQCCGCVSAESRLGEGSTFHVLLPVARCEAAPTEAEAEEVPEKSFEDRGSERILVVEDDQILRELVCEVLESKGYDVLQAATPKAALDQLEHGLSSVDLLLSDIVMPEISGPELAQRLSRHFPEMQVLLMSGYATEDLEQRGTDLAAVSTCIKKPFSTRELTRKVRELLDPRSTTLPVD